MCRDHATLLKAESQTAGTHTPPFPFRLSPPPLPFSILPRFDVRSGIRNADFLIRNKKKKKRKNQSLFSFVSTITSLNRSRLKQFASRFFFFFTRGSGDRAWTVPFFPPLSSNEFRNGTRLGRIFFFLSLSLSFFLFPLISM